MALEARALVTDGLDALARLDTEAAKRVIAADAALDALERETVQRLLHRAARDPALLRSVFRLGYVARCLERLGDHATNVAEMTLYVANATVARHRSAAAAGEALASMT
jgi:phosphate transport system protein